MAKNIYKYCTKNGKTQYRVRLSDGKYKRGFNTISEAKQFQLKYNLKLEQQKDEELKKQEELANLSEEEKILVNMTFDDMGKEYLKMRKRELKHSSYRKLERAYNNVVLPNSKNKKIVEYTRLDTIAFSDKIYKIDCTIDTKNYYLRIYKGIFKYSEKKYLNNNNPTYAIDYFKNKSRKVKKHNCWSVEEFEKFINALDEEVYKLFYTVLYFTGLRIGEALALTWEDFDGTNLNINKARNKEKNENNEYIDDTKTVSSIRNINIGNLSDLLNEYKNKKKRNPFFKENWYIFGGVKPISRETSRRRKCEAIKKAGLRPITIHDFRHSHATNLLDAGIPISAISARLGHSNSSITLATYIHETKESENQAIEYINAILPKCYHDSVDDTKK